MKKFPNQYFPEFLIAKNSDWPDSVAIQKKMEELQIKFPEKIACRTIGKSVENRPILLVEISDFKVSDENKQLAVFIAAEHGGERSATGTILALIDWLLSNAGKEILQQQRILFVPVVNVDPYDTDGNLVNRNDVNLFADYHYDGKMPSQPESQAIWKILEENNPDIFISMHGMSPDYDRSAYHRDWESTGVAYTNFFERGYSRKFIEKVNETAEQAGYPMDLGEEDLERVLPWIPGFEYHSLPTFGHGAGSPSYCYNRFHSLGFVMEIGPVKSGLLRCQEILKLGNKCWEYECFSGYPNRIITSACIAKMTLTAGGKTAEERRVNRVKLWQHSKNLTTGIGGRDATRFFGFFSKTEEDYNELSKFKNAGVLLEYFEEHGIPVKNTLDLLGEEWKQPPLVWNDAKAIARINEREDVNDFPVPSYDKALKTESLDADCCLRMRLDKEVKVENLLLNDDSIELKNCRQWQDSRYAYIEVDISDDLSRVIIAMKTSKRPNLEI